MTDSEVAPISPPPPPPSEDDPLAPIVKPLWRLPMSQRRAKMLPFVGYPVRVERWLTRVASGGDVQYDGTLIAVADNTLTPSILAIIQTVDGTVWAVSSAQIAYLACTLRQGGRSANRNPTTD